MRLVTLDEISTKEPFDCGDTDLNGFLNDKSIFACRFLTVDAYKEALPFYEKNGFKFLVNNIEDCEFTVPMYYDLIQLK